MSSIITPTKYFVFAVLASLLVTVGTLTVSPTPAEAQTREQLQAQIQQLLQIVAQMQAQIAAMESSSTPAQPGGGFAKSITVGDKVQTTDMLKVRAYPGISNLLAGTAPALTAGTVVDGPQYLNGYTWWKVNYDTTYAGSPLSGWSAENWLRFYPRPQSTDNVQSVDPTCTISSDKREVERNEVFVISWEANFENPVLVSPGKGEELVVSTGSRSVSTTYGPTTFELGSNKLGTVCSETVYLENTSTAYDIDITEPDSGDEFESGDSFYLEWNQDNLEGEQGIVTLEGDNRERHIKQYVDIDSEEVRVTIPTSDELGAVTPGDYELRLWVSYIKDGSPKGVGDSIDISINQRDTGSLDVDLAADPASGRAPWKTTFTYTMNTEKTCDAVGHQIDFGDGTRTVFTKGEGVCGAYEQRSDHTYHKKGAYTVTLSACTEATDTGESCPLQELDTTTVTVAEAEVIEFSADDSGEGITLHKEQRATNGLIDFTLTTINSDSVLLYMEPEGYNSSYVSLGFGEVRTVANIEMSLSSVSPENNQATIEIRSAQKG